MPDLLPDQTIPWQEIEEEIRMVTDQYCYREIRLPILERTELFKRSIGESTDIVEKEMYTFSDNKGESISMRPEATASCVRAGIQHGLINYGKHRWWYLGPMFRYERPQKGRFRQFYQFGVEAFGWEEPAIDAEIILLAERLWDALGIENHVYLEVNTLGAAESRTRYTKELVAYFQDHHAELDADSQRRLHTNPLRILDSKNSKMQALIDSAPVITDYLTAESQENFSELCDILTALNIAYRVNPRLVRGLDYYSTTVFEWTADHLGAQNAICAGGRYDGLVESLGGKQVPAAGFACGMERLVEMVQQIEVDPNFYTVTVFVACMDKAGIRKAVEISERARDHGLEVMTNFAGGNIRRQLRQAHKSKSILVIIIGEREIESGTVTVKPFVTQRPQRNVKEDQLMETIWEELEYFNLAL